MNVPAIEAQLLTKEYSNGRGCRDVSITVEKGEAFGFLGPNGAGKSTFVKMLAGLIRPTSGSAALFGHPVGTLAAKAKIGYLPELYRYQEWLTGEEVVRLHARLCGIDKSVADRRIPELLKEVGIGLRGRDRVKHYSKGMQQRLGLACALVNEPELVFLDEPSSALDPIGRMEVRTILERLKQRGITIFLNSHLREEVDVLCERMALLNNGEILRHGKVTDILNKRTSWHFKVGGYSPFLLSWLTELTGLQIRQAVEDGDHEGVGRAVASSVEGSTVWLAAEVEREEQVGWLNTLIMEQGLTLYEVARKKTRLEEWFVDAVSGLSHRGEQE
ncbi:ABC transporter [Paenibacillus riograndensis]|nr:ABC transporter [Paenibacillus riograndensis]